MWAWPLWIGVRAPDVAPTVRKDVQRWVDHHGDDDFAGLSGYGQFALLAHRYPEFRSVVHHRLQSTWLPVRLTLRMLYPGLRTLHLWTDDIGPGLVIEDGAGSIIGAESIGANCCIGAEVSVGFTAKGTPVVGDDVYFGSGAKVVGRISIGNGAIIGPNAVVMSDVESHAILQAPPSDKEQN
ncbi:serine acetyltransferase [Mycobacterium sp. CPCC 205372]|uniref:Serine acetyltransferase n=1 Tax=Mycobacterium hippophais TaxID=3016340 RepID=A0ABT4PRU6_9MYCO|nr:serine acetyltransferase [Mycobacterium hippophais]MCZ8379279.1 serine acetyltransferase [Mycobacterium hippophais]